MDGQRFDEITKAVASGTSRRLLLRGLVAGVAGLLTAGRGRAQVEAVQRCKGAGGTCGSDRDCCQNNPARCANGKCCPKPRYCEATGTCCPPGQRCCNGECTSGPCRKAQGETCAAGRECTSGFCVDGVCCDTACAGECEACTLEGSLGTCTPLNGAECSGGVCVNGTCCLGPQYLDCAADAGEMCCQDEPCCPMTGECCTDCFYDSDTNANFFCCPELNVCGDFCCFGSEKCVVSETGFRRCVDSRLVCNDGKQCPEECCGGVCCSSDEFCHNGTCLTTDTSACTTHDECPAGEQCVGVTYETQPPSGEGGEPTIVATPGTCCPSARVCAIPDPNAGQPDGPPADYCCGYGSRCGSEGGTCCSVETHLKCSGACACSPRGSRVRF